MVPYWLKLRTRKKTFFNEEFFGQTMTDSNEKRVSIITRNTNETKISVKVELDGKGNHSISTGLPFFDHMLEQISKHSLIDLDLKCIGDLKVDAHHTMEDCGWALGLSLIHI